MIRDRESVAMLAVRDVNKAAAFYEGTLGFAPGERMGDEVATYRSGRSTFNVYKSEYAGTNRATALVWDVGRELDDTVRNLKAKGVRFEHYDMPGMSREGDVHVNGDMRVAWFKDLDGNILSLTNQ